MITPWFPALEIKCWSLQSSFLGGKEAGVGVGGGGGGVISNSIH